MVCHTNESSATMQREQSPSQCRPFKLRSSQRINNWSSSLCDLYGLSLGSPRMYADDTNVTFAVSNMIDLESQINTELRGVARIFP